MNRRGFLQGILAAGVAPAVVGSGILMPIRKIVKPQYHEWVVEALPATKAFDTVVMRSAGNRILTAEEITREAIRIFNAIPPISVSIGYDIYRDEHVYVARRK